MNIYCWSPLFYVLIEPPFVYAIWVYGNANVKPPWGIGFLLFPMVASLSNKMVDTFQKCAIIILTQWVNQTAEQHEPFTVFVIIMMPWWARLMWRHHTFLILKCIEYTMASLSPIWENFWLHSGTWWWHGGLPKKMLDWTSIHSAKIISPIFA